MTLAVQCLLSRNGDMQTSFIPKEHAVEGHYVRLKDNGQWTDGWRVVRAYHPPIPYEVVEENERNYKSHRKATDI